MRNLNLRRHLKGEEHKLPVGAVACNLKKVVNLPRLDQSLASYYLQYSTKMSSGLFIDNQTKIEPIVRHDAGGYFIHINGTPLVAMDGSALIDKLKTCMTADKPFRGDIAQLDVRGESINEVLKERSINYFLKKRKFSLVHPDPYTRTKHLAVALLKNHLADLSSLYMGEPRDYLCGQLNGDGVDIYAWKDDIATVSSVLQLYRAAEQLIFPEGNPATSGDEWPCWHVDYSNTNSDMVTIYKLQDYRVLKYHELAEVGEDTSEQYEGFK